MSLDEVADAAPPSLPLFSPATALIGGTPWPRDWGSCSSRCEIEPVLDAITARPRELEDTTRDALHAGISIRIDASRGLNDRLQGLLSRIAQYPLEATVLLPLVGPSFGYACEGRFHLSLRSIDAMQSIANAGFPIGLLAQPLTVLREALASPSTVWKDVLAQGSRHGLTFRYAASPLSAAFESILSSAWVCRATDRLAQASILAELDQSEWQGFEWQFERGPDLVPWIDGIERFSIAACRGPDGGSVFRRRLFPSVDFIIHTDVDGWRVIRRGSGEELLSSAAAASVLRDAPFAETILIAIDPNHVTHVIRREQVGVRALPWPYDHAVAVASDVDWTTRGQFEQSVERVCDELGLRYASSAYLTSSSKRWPSWEDLTRGGEQRAFILRHALEGSLDTIHGIAWSFEGKTVASGTARGSGPIRQELDEPVNVKAADGLFLLTDRGVWPLPKVALQDELGRWVTGEWSGNGAEETHTCSFLPWPKALSGALVALEIGWAGVTEPVAWNIMFVRGATSRSQAILNAMQHAGVRPPVFTAHGGGHRVDDWGQLRTAWGLKIYPRFARMALDAPESPFECLGSLRSAGVAFANPIDIMFSSRLKGPDDLLQEEVGQDGTRFYAFERYRPNIFDTHAFSHGKHVATAQALPAVLSHLLHEALWRGEPSASIVYTHLGNRVGNAATLRLGWTEELHAAWERLAAWCRCGSEIADPPQRVWVVPPAAILAHAAVRRGLRSNLRFDGSGAHITSWLDNTLGHRIPDPDVWGGAWLHGISIVLPNGVPPAIHIDGTRYAALTRERDDEGRSILTLIDENQLVALIPAGGLTLAQRSAPKRLVIHPVTLRQATHLKLAVKGLAAGSRVGLETNGGSVYWIACGTVDSDVCWPTDPNRVEPLFVNLDAGRCSRRPTGHILALHLANAGLSEEPIRLEGAWLVRPRPAWRPSSACRLGGVVRNPDGALVRDATIVARFGQEVRTATSDESGFYLFDLPRHATIELMLQSPKETAAFFHRGRIFQSSADCLNWDISVWPRETSVRSTETQ